MARPFSFAGDVPGVTGGEKKTFVAERLGVEGDDASCTLGEFSGVGAGCAPARNVFEGEVSRSDGGDADTVAGSLG